MKTKNLVNLAEYGRICGISREAVRQRIKRGQIKTTVLHKRIYINLADFPPVEKLKNSGRKL